MINSFETLFEARERKFQQERLFRGESVDLVARITTDGVLDNLSDYTISGVYQPVGDDPEGLTYTVDSEIRDGKAILHWTNDNDFGKTAYNVWGLLMKDGKGAYPIAWRLNFANSPSYPIDEINPLVRTIDFDKYDLLNAPWVPLSGGNLSGRIYLQEGETPSTLISSYLGDATGLGRGIITIYDETEASLEAKLTQSGSSVAAKWIFTYFDTPTGEIVFPENPQVGDTFEVFNGIGTKYLNGADVTMEQGTTMFQWQTGDTPFEVPCLTLHNIVTRYTYNSTDGWTASSTYDWSICKVNGEWYANGFNNGYSAHDSIVWHEESSGEQPILDPFVLQSELDEAVEETKEDIKQTLQDEYLPLSGGTVSGDFAVQNFLSSTSSGVFLGKNQDLNQYAELAIGNNLSVGMVGLAMGSNSEARSNDITIGHNAKSPYGGGNIVIGNGASTAANGTTVVGTNAKASGGNAIAIGTAANATHSGEVRLGGPQGNLQPQLWLFETPIISGPDTSILSARLPYLSAYAKTEDLADYATQEWVEEYVDEHGGASGDYLPLSGGVVNGPFAVENFLSAWANPWTGRGGKLKIGIGAKVYDDSSVFGGLAVGNNVSATGIWSVGIGNNVSATGLDSLAIGGDGLDTPDRGATAATNTNSVAIGIAARATGGESLALGDFANATGFGTIGIGTDVSADGDNSIVFGWHARAAKRGSVQIGEGTNDGVSCLNYLSANIIEPLSGNLAINPDRLPYLADYATQEWVNEQISSIPQPSPPIPAGILTIKQNDTTVAEYNPDTGTNVSATIYVPTVPTDLSDFTNSPQYATETWVNGQIDIVNGRIDGVADDLSTNYIQKQTSEVQTISTPLWNLQPLSAFELNAAYGTNAAGVTVMYGTVSLNNYDGRKTTLYPARTLWERVGGRQKQVPHNPEIISYNIADLSTYTLTIPYKTGTAVVDSDLSSYATESYVDTKIGDINSILDSVNGQII